MTHGQWSLQEYGFRYTIGKALLEERIVRGVLEQPPDQIRHARKQLAVGRVDPHPQAHRFQHVLDRVGHAVEHLEFEVRLRHFQLLGDGQGVRDAADVVAAEGRPEPGVIPHQEGRAAFEVVVRLPLLSKYWYRPAILRGDHGFVIPVRPLHEADPDRALPFVSRPIQQLLQISRSVLQIGLDGDADVGPVAELWLGEDLAEDAQGRVFEGELLHVEIHERPVFPGQRQDRTQATADDLRCSFRVDWVELAK